MCTLEFSAASASRDDFLKAINRLNDEHFLRGRGRYPASANSATNAQTTSRLHNLIGYLRKTKRIDEISAVTKIIGIVGGQKEIHSLLSIAEDPAMPPETIYSAILSLGAIGGVDACKALNKLGNQLTSQGNNRMIHIAFFERDKVKVDGIYNSMLGPMLNEKNVPSIVTDSYKL